MKSYSRKKHLFNENRLLSLLITPIFPSDVLEAPYCKSNT